MFTLQDKNKKKNPPKTVKMVLPRGKRGQVQGGGEPRVGIAKRRKKNHKERNQKKGKVEKKPPDCKRGILIKKHPCPRSYKNKKPLPTVKPRSVGNHSCVQGHQVMARRTTCEKQTLFIT